MVFFNAGLFSEFNVLVQPCGSESPVVFRPSIQYACVHHRHIHRPGKIEKLENVMLVSLVFLFKSL